MFFNSIDTDQNMNAVPATSNRVESQTHASINQKMQQCAVDHVQQMMNKSKTEIGVQLKQLDREWDMERLLEFNASSLCLIGILLSVFYSKYWLILSFGVVAFLWQHAGM